MTTARPTPAPGASGASVVGGPERLRGVDLARALALLGMIAAHVGGVAEEFDVADPGSWSAVVNGRSSTLFAVLAGVSIGLVSGRTDPPAPPTIGRIRARLAIRAVVVVAVGVLLMALGTPVYVILPTYGVLFVLVLPVLRWRWGSLLALAGVCAVVSPVVAVLIAPLYAHAGVFGQQLGLVYPVVTFGAYVLVGLALARHGWEDRITQTALVASGVLVAAVAYGLGNALAPVPAASVSAVPGVPFIPTGAPPGVALAHLFLSPGDHSSSTVDVLGTAGIAVAVIGACALIVDGRGPIVARIAAPLVAVGSMPLSVYTLHVVVLAFLPEWPQSPAAWWWFALGSVAFATAWRRFLGRGPLERLVARAAAAVPR